MVWGGYIESVNSHAAERMIAHRTQLNGVVVMVARRRRVPSVEHYLDSYPPGSSRPYAVSLMEFDHAVAFDGWRVPWVCRRCPTWP